MSLINFPLSFSFEEIISVFVLFLLLKYNFSALRIILSISIENLEPFLNDFEGTY